MSRSEVLRLMDDLVEGRTVLEGVTEETSDGDVLKLIHDKGYNVEKAELEEFINGLGEVLRQQELSDEDLDKVAGGFSPFKAIGKGMAGTALGAIGGIHAALSKGASAVGADSVADYTETTGDALLTYSKRSFKRTVEYLHWDEPSRRGDFLTDVAYPEGW